MKFCRGNMLQVRVSLGYIAHRVADFVRANDVCIAHVQIMHHHIIVRARTCRMINCLHVFFYCSKIRVCRLTLKTLFYISMLDCSSQWCFGLKTTSTHRRSARHSAKSVVGLAKSSYFFSISCNCFLLKHLPFFFSFTYVPYLHTFILAYVHTMYLLPHATLAQETAATCQPTQLAGASSYRSPPKRARCGCRILLHQALGCMQHITVGVWCVS